MYLTNKTLTKDVLPLLNKSNFEVILKAVPTKPIKKDVVDMTIDEFSDILDMSDYDLLTYYAKKNRKALDFLGKLKNIQNQLKGFSNFIKRYDIKHSQDENQACMGVVFPTLAESMLYDVIKFYNLNSLNEAKRITVNEYLFTVKINGCTLKYQSNYQKIMDSKTKLKSK